MTNDSMRTRAARIIREYDRQGVHRTATPVDAASADWLEREIADAGGAAERQAFRLQRLDVRTALMKIGDRIIEGLPKFDGGLTGPEGTSGRLCPPTEDGDIAFLGCGPRGNDTLAAVREGRRHKAIVVATDCGKPGLSPINADAFNAPYGPPILQVSSEHTGLLERAAVAKEPISVVVDARHMPAEACNVTARIRGRNPTLPPLLVMTPRSGWWNCASERGGGLVLLLEILRAMAAGTPDRDVIFTANSGHELGHLGLDAFLEANPGLVNRAHCWIHLGANFGAAIGAAPRLQSSDAGLRNLALTHMRAHDAPPATEILPGARPGGEARNVFEGGGRYVSLLGDNGLFHHPDDRFPEAVDLDVTVRIARAFIGVAAELARSDAV